MRTAIKLALLVVSGSQVAVGQHFRLVTIPTGPGSRWITVADVNHDRNSDILVANAGSESDDSGSITVLLGDGHGGFQPAVNSPLPAGHLPNDIATGDINNDGNLDIVVTNHQSPYLRLFLGDGHGGLRLAPATKSRYSAATALGVSLRRVAFSRPGAVPMNDFELRTSIIDGHADTVTTNLDDNTVSILLGDGRGGLRNAPGSPFPAGAKPWELVIDDVNGDGNPDLIIIPYQRDISRPSENVLTVLLGDGHGAFHTMLVPRFLWEIAAALIASLPATLSGTEPNRSESPAQKAERCSSFGERRPGTSLL